MNLCPNAETIADWTKCPLCNPERSVQVMTDAPAAYDYASTRQLSADESLAVGSRMVTVRRVSIPESEYRFQVGRYYSGMYIAVTLDEDGQPI